MKAYAGIDNGKSGAIAVVHGDGAVDLHSMPMLQFSRREIYDDIYIRDLLLAAKARSGDLHLVFELGQIQPLWSAKSNHLQGAYMGMICAVIRQNRINATGVNPKDWQGLMLAGFKGDTKTASVAACARHFPQVSLIAPRCRKADDGKADALNMARYGMTMKF